MFPAVMVEEEEGRELRVEEDAMRGEVRFVAMGVFGGDPEELE
jgi:hypothetical protein